MGRLLELFSLVPPPPRLAPKQTVTWVREDASRQSLQPTYCQRAPLKPINSRARGSHLADRLIRVWPSANTLVLVSDTAPSEPAPDSPKAFPIPSDVAIGGATPVVVRHRSHLFEATPVFLGGCQLPRWGLIPPRTPNDVTTYTLCRAAPLAPVFTDPLDTEPRTFPTDTHQGIRFPGPECFPPISPFRRVLSSRSEQDLGAATGPLA